MNNPLVTPVRQAKLGLSSKSFPITNDYRKILNDQHQRLTIKHQQDLELIDDIRSYVKARLSIERDYTSALNKLAKHHSAHIAKKFTLINQTGAGGGSVSQQGKGGDCAKNADSQDQAATSRQFSDANKDGATSILQHYGTGPNNQDSNYQGRLDTPQPEAYSLYKVWSEHISRLQNTSKNRANQFEQLIMVVDKLKDIRSHKTSIGKKSLETHLKRIHDDVLCSIIDVDKSKKLYYEDESQAKKARENEEKIKKKRSGLLTKFTDLQAKKEKTSAQREANDIQSTQARNDYIMALAAANAHLELYYQRDLNDFMHTIDDGVLDHCKVFMATLSECDINSLKDSLLSAQAWSQMISSTGSHRTNSIFLDFQESTCLKTRPCLEFEPCNDDPIHSISLEHNADYALQHEIDKWFTWFKKECRNLSQLMHQLETCQRAFAEGRKTIELNGQNPEDLESKIIDLKQQIRKCEAAKLKAQARLKVIKEGGMRIDEWSAVELEIRADMARLQEKLDESRVKGVREDSSPDDQTEVDVMNQAEQVQLHVTKDVDDLDETRGPLASVSRSTSNLIQKQQNAASGLSTLADPSLVWQDDFSSAWGNSNSNYNVVVTDTYDSTVNKSKQSNIATEVDQGQEYSGYNLLSASNNQSSSQQQQQNPNSSQTVQSSSPLSAIVDGDQTNTSPYQGIVGDNKSDYECDYNRNGQIIASAASSTDPYNPYTSHQQQATSVSRTNQLDLSEVDSEKTTLDENNNINARENILEISSMINRRVIAMYSFEKTNEDDLEFKENDILRVIHVEDADWVRAKNEKTGQDGYIPTSYVRLLDEESEAEYGYQNDYSELALTNDINTTQNEQSLDLTEQQTGQNESYEAEAFRMCRAVYDYTPEVNTFEDDGLPHLALTQGEIMKILHSADDGWWLVEKEGKAERGHVPSMLVEEIVQDDENEDEEDIEDDEADSNNLEGGDDEEPGSVPCFAPPSLPPPPPLVLDDDGDQQQQFEQIDHQELSEPSSEFEEKVDDGSMEKQDSTTIKGQTEDIILTQSDNEPGQSNAIGQKGSPNETCLVGDRGCEPVHEQAVGSKTANNDFISEENLAEECSEGQTQELSSKALDRNNYEPLSEVDSLETPAPPSVVIDNYDEGKEHNSPSFYDDVADDNSQRGFESDTENHRPLDKFEMEQEIRQEAISYSRSIISQAIDTLLEDVEAEEESSMSPQQHYI